MYILRAQWGRTILSAAAAARSIGAAASYSYSPRRSSLSSLLTKYILTYTSSVRVLYILSLARAALTDLSHVAVYTTPGISPTLSLSLL